MASKRDIMKTQNNRPVIVILALLVVGLAVAIFVWRTGDADTPDVNGATAVTSAASKPFPNMVVERMGDPDYRAALKALTDERRETVGAAAVVRSKMETLATELTTQLREDDAETTQTAIEAGIRQHPQWSVLEAELSDIQKQLAEIRRRTLSTVRGRMSEQYAARRGARPTPPPRDRVIVRVATNTMVLASEPIVVTNRPGGTVKPLPVKPERTPVANPQPSATTVTP
jgi:hypothetical protein